MLIEVLASTCVYMHVQITVSFKTVHGNGQFQTFCRQLTIPEF